VRRIAATLVFAGLVAGCGSSGSSAPQSGAGPSIGAPIELADCTDWEQASTDQRLGTIDQLKDFAGGPVVGGGSNPASGTGAVLTDDQAYDLLDNYCQQDYARAFKLYKLYERAAAFAGQPAQ
jgi:hypothetical protein